MIDLDLSQLNLRSVNERLQATLPGANEQSYRVLHPNGCHALAVGLTQPIEVKVEGLEYDFAVPVLFLGLTVIGLVRRPAIVAAVVGFAVAVVASPLPNRSGLLVGAFAGILAGALVDRDEL